MQQWDPATTGGHADLGILMLPIVPVGGYLLLLCLVALAIRKARGAEFGPPRTWATRIWAWLRRPMGGWARVLNFVFVMPALLLPTLLMHWDPLSGTDPVAPGPQTTEVRDDGLWTADGADWSDISKNTFERCLSDCGGPRFIVRVQPGERYWSLMTVRNDGPLPVVLEGTGADPAWAGLARLVDSAKLSADASNLRPWEPVNLSPGESVTIAVIHVAEACADPGGAIDAPVYSTSQLFVYSVLGWRREGDASRHASVTVAGCSR